MPPLLECGLWSEAVEKNAKTVAGNEKSCLSLQRQSEEFVERTTTFMTITVVSSLNSIRAITLQWWLCFLSLPSAERLEVTRIIEYYK